MHIQTVAKDCLFPFFSCWCLYQKKKTSRILLLQEKNPIQINLSIILCVIAFAWLSVCYFRELENKLCEERGYDQADVFMIAKGGGQSLCQRPDFQCKAQKLKTNPTIYQKIQSHRDRISSPVLWCVLLKNILEGKKGKSFSTYFGGSWHTFEAEEVTDFFRKTWEAAAHFWRKMAVI